jgi:hypothetical protein
LWALQQNKDSFAIVEDSASLLTQYEIDCALQTGEATTTTFPSSLQERANEWHWDKKKSGEAKSEDQQLYWASPLQFLAHFCQKTGIPAYNVECRTIIEVYEEINFDNEQEHEKGQQIVYKTLYDYIKPLRNTDELSTYCTILDQKFQNLSSMIGSSDQKSFQEVANHIRWILLEAHMLYQLEKCKHMTHGYVITGAAHIADIKPNLPILGYKHIKTIGMPLTTHIPDNVLASNPLDLHKTFTEIFNEQQ